MKGENLWGQNIKRYTLRVNNLRVNKHYDSVHWDETSLTVKHTIIVVKNSEKDRISMALFCQPDPDVEVEPVQELVTRDKKRRYKCVKNYLATFFKYDPDIWKSYRNIESVRL